MGRHVDQVFIRLGRKWLVPPEILRDIYSLMKNDVRFMSTKGCHGVRYKKMEVHLRKVYHIDNVNERMLRYLVREIKRRKNQELGK